MEKQLICVFEWRKSVHYWWSYILFSPECKELTSMLDPLLYKWGVPPVVIRCVHWTMQMGVLLTWIMAQSTVIVMNSECLDPYWFLSCLGNFWPSGGQKHSKGGVSRAPSQWHMKFEFHQNQVSASEEFSGLFSKCFVVSTWKLVYTLSRLHNILSSLFH